MERDQSVNQSWSTLADGYDDQAGVRVCVRACKSACVRVCVHQGHKEVLRLTGSPFMPGYRGFRG